MQNDPADNNSTGESGPDEFMAYPIDGTLDLHTFRANEVHDLVPEYLAACRQKNIFLVRIIHGKGTGTLRRLVHSILKKISWVETFYLAGPGSGGWGATVIHLKPRQ